ncbi:MAG: glycine betaine ABC transporter substrate-binding protein [Spirochaetaceae bacterium]
MRKVLLSILIMSLAVGMAFAEGSQEEGGAQAEDRGDVRLAYVEWARAVAITHVTQEVLERLGWDVEALSVANAAMWSSVATGDADALLAAWLPATHGMFYGEEGEYTDDVENLGHNYTGARLGLVVPEYVEEESISDLAENADRYDGEIIGIDPGAGMMQQTEEMIENDTYGMGDFELVEGSDATMMAALQDAIRQEEPVVVTGWAPHVKFARFDLKILEDPENVYGESETIDTVVRNGLEDDDPDLYAVLSEMDWSAIEDDVIGEVMVLVDEGTDPTDAAEQAVSENVDLVNEALPSGFEI